LWRRILGVDLQGFRWRWILRRGSTITMANSAEDEEVIADLTELQVTDSRPMVNVYCCPHAGACRPRACLSCPLPSPLSPSQPGAHLRGDPRVEPPGSKLKEHRSAVPALQQ
jgi:hypothetical protein